MHPHNASKYTPAVFPISSKWIKSVGNEKSREGKMGWENGQKDKKGNRGGNSAYT